MHCNGSGPPGLPGYQVINLEMSTINVFKWLMKNTMFFLPFSRSLSPVAFERRDHPVIKATEVTSDRPAWWDPQVYQVNHTHIYFVCQSVFVWSMTIRKVVFALGSEIECRWMIAIVVWKIPTSGLTYMCVCNLFLSMRFYLTIDFGRSVDQSVRRWCDPI